MVETAGTKLRRARQQRQLGVEDASRATKIRAHQIADLENDEYSNFANLAYAKSFLIAYGKYLRVDMRPYKDAFADASTFGMDDYQYLSDTPLGVFRSSRRMPRQQPKIRRKQIVAACSMVGVLAILLFCRLMYNTYERLGGDLDKLAERREAHERAAHEVKTTTASSEPVPTAAPALPEDDAAPRSQPDDTLTANDARLAVAPVELPALVPSVSASAVFASAPAVPIPGDGTAVREAMTTPVSQPSATGKAGTSDRSATARRPSIFLGDDAQPQTVVNDRPARPVN